MRTMLANPISQWSEVSDRGVIVVGSGLTLLGRVAASAYVSASSDRT